jgi:hypothetical protein
VSFVPVPAMIVVPAGRSRAASPISPSRQMMHQRDERLLVHAPLRVKRGDDRGQHRA